MKNAPVWGVGNSMVAGEGVAALPAATLVGFAFGSALAVPLARQALAGSTPCTLPPHEKRPGVGRRKFDGGWGGSRTPDTGIFSPLLYQLSYPAECLLAYKPV